MKKLKIFLTYISSNRVWIITLACLDVFFIFLAWLANPDYFINYVALIIFVSFATLAIPLAISIRKRNKTDAIFRRFLLEPDDTNEYLLCEAVPAVLRPYICELGQHLRTQQEYINEQKITVTDYQHYIENWVHEIKKPLSLMTLLLDNRKDEMSPLVHTRMLYVRDHTRQDIEQILYFSRLGATHKDYFFEPLSILEICREAVEDNLTLLEEAGFSVEYTENDAQVISDKKGLMFILGQIISNSVKYTGNNPAPRLLFSIPMDYLEGEIIPGDKLFTMPSATSYEFGILMSNVHMAWTRAVCGRLKSDYSYSNMIVYNNFPWPSPTNDQKEKIRKTAQAILNARALYTDSNLADLYDPLTMPTELLKAHKANNRAVMHAYGFSIKMSEADCVAELMRMYQKLTKEK